MTNRAPKPRIFYGWIMVAVAIMLALATMPGQTMLLALYNTSIREALGLSITQFSAAFSIGTILASLPLPLVGRIADRFGLRVTIAAVALGFAASLILLREAGGIISLGMCFFLVRLLGQGSLSMLSLHTVSLWFERRLGTANALLSVLGFAGGSALLPRPVAWLIAEHGWRTALLISAGGVLVIVLPLVLFAFRNRPADIGQHLDGDPAEHTSHDVMHGGSAPPGDPAFNVRQAVSTRAFWILVVNMMTTGMVGTALIFHMQTMLEHAGLEGTAEQAAVAIMPWPIVFGVVTLIVGWMADRLHPAKILPPALLIKAAAVLICLSATWGMVETEWVLPLMATGMAVYGAAQATVIGVANPTLARYFGRTHHGAIRGTISTAIVMGTGGGPYIVALGYGLAGENFTPILLVFVAWALPLGLFSMLLRKPEPPVVRDLTPEPDEPDPPGVVL